MILPKLISIILSHTLFDMRYIRFVLLLTLLHCGLPTNAQIQFVGFDHPTCPQQSSNVYTYSNYTSGGGGSGTILGYTIFRNGVVVFGESGTMGSGRICKDLVFVNDSIGFLVTYSGNMAISVLRTQDYGVSWTLIGGGAPNYFGMYVVNYTTAYVVTQWDTPMQFRVAKCSSIAAENDILFIYDQTITTDVYRTDTLLYSDMCGVDSLNILVQNGVDTVTYHINIFGYQSSLNSDLYIDETKIKLFPNPTSDGFWVDYPQNEIETIRLLSMAGNEVYCLMPKTVNSGYYSTEELASGTYFVEIRGKDQSVSVVKLIVR